MKQPKMISNTGSQTIFIYDNYNQLETHFNSMQENGWIGSIYDESGEGLSVKYRNLTRSAVRGNGLVVLHS